MKKILPLVLSLFVTFNNVFSQGNLTITFAATGESTTVDDVTATNLATNETISFPGDEELLLQDVTTNIQDLSDDNDIEIVLKQHGSFTQLNYLNRKKQPVTVKLVSLSGETAASYSGVLLPGVQQFDISTATGGLYLLSVITETGISSVKVIQNPGGANSVTFSGTQALPDKKVRSHLKATMSNVLNYTPGDIISYEIKSGNNVTVVNERPVESKTITAYIAVCKDYDGNYYKIVKMGDQIWMAENIKTTHYPNGVAIPNVIEDVDWRALYGNTDNDAYCWYDNDENNKDIYGGLYTLSAAFADNWANDNKEFQGICPDGWHLPNDNEWKDLERFLGMSEDEVNKLGYRGTNEGSKLAGNAGLWFDGDLENNTDFALSGFFALPAGYRYYSTGSFSSLGYSGSWWTRTMTGGTTAYYRTIFYSSIGVGRSDLVNKTNGNSVRCVKD